MSDSDDKDVEMMIMMSMEGELEKQEKHVLNFKGRRVFPRDRITDAKLVYKGYFKPGPTFA